MGEERGVRGGERKKGFCRSKSSGGSEERYLLPSNRPDRVNFQGFLTFYQLKIILQLQTTCSF